MIEIKVKTYLEWRGIVDSNSLPHFNYKHGTSYRLIAVDGQISFNHSLDDDDNAHYILNYLPKSNRKMGNFYTNTPFASKILDDGTKLYRRKHGQSSLIPANSTSETIFTCPYIKAKVNKLEIVGCNSLDLIDLLIKSPIDPVNAATYQMPPNILLNQFGFDVAVSGNYYEDKSDYDADIFEGIQVVIVYHNKSSSDVKVGFNLIYHQLV